MPLRSKIPTYVSPYHAEVVWFSFPFFFFFVFARNVKVLNMVKLYGKPIKVKQASQDRKQLDIGVIACPKKKFLILFSHAEDKLSFFLARPIFLLVTWTQRWMKRSAARPTSDIQTQMWYYFSFSVYLCCFLWPSYSTTHSRPLVASLKLKSCVIRTQVILPFFFHVLSTYQQISVYFSYQTLK
jgi:hypothetical protein